MDWRTRWELEAQREFDNFSKLSEADLLLQIENGRTGNYYQIWRAIGAKGIRQNSAIVLWRFLQQHPGDNNMHDRYHCSAALMRILNLPAGEMREELRKRIQWDHHGEEARQAALLELKGLIDS